MVLLLEVWDKCNAGQRLFRIVAIPCTNDPYIFSGKRLKPVETIISLKSFLIVSLIDALSNLVRD